MEFLGGLIVLFGRRLSTAVMYYHLRVELLIATGGPKLHERVQDKYFMFMPGQINICLVFLVPCKSDFSGVLVYSSLHWTSHFFQGTRKTAMFNCSPCMYKKYIFKKLR